MGKLVTIYTDGACVGNPGPGGYCAILVYKGAEKILHGGERETTNNRMELKAAINGLKALKRPCKVKIISDSKYVVNGINEWMEGWATKGFRGIKNDDLWKELYALKKTHDVEAEWVKAHSGHEMNEKCDSIARAEAERRARLSEFEGSES